MLTLELLIYFKLLSQANKHFLESKFPRLLLLTYIHNSIYLFNFILLILYILLILTFQAYNIFQVLIKLFTIYK
jgi:hypothetical protein